MSKNSLSPDPLKMPDSSPNQLTQTNNFNTTATSPNQKQTFMMSRTQVNSFRQSRASEVPMLPKLNRDNSYDSTVQAQITF